jgi:hypothetical protein
MKDAKASTNETWRPKAKPVTTMGKEKRLD